MGREYDWQKSALCGLGCVWYKVRDDGTEACEKVGFRLHDDWCDVALGCDDYETAMDAAARERKEEARRARERKSRKRGEG